jgi:RimJ/RimL family protein N-acetyltransferase
MQMKKVSLRNSRIATIREATVDDAAAVLDYLEEVTAETDFLAVGKGEFDWTLEKERQFIADHRSADNKLLILAEVEGHIAGISGFTGDFRKRLRHTGESGLSVLRRHWGLGLGTALMASVIEWAKSSGVVRKIDLRVRVDNERALHLYERFGFVREGVITRQFAVAGAFYDAYLMGLEVDPEPDRNDAER